MTKKRLPTKEEVAERMANGHPEPISDSEWEAGREQDAVDAAATDTEPAKQRKPRGEIRYSLYGTPRGQDVEEYVTSLPTVTQAHKWLLASATMVSKLYRDIRVVAEKTRQRAAFGDSPITEAKMAELLNYTPRTRTTKQD